MQLWAIIDTQEKTLTIQQHVTGTEFTDLLTDK